MSLWWNVGSYNYSGPDIFVPSCSYINYVVVLWRSHVYFDPIKVYMKKVMLATIRIRTDQNEHSPLH